MAKGLLKNKTLNQEVYNKEAIDEKFDEFTPVDGALLADDVVNNLTSTEAKKPLSANQGRVLNTTKAGLDGGNIFTGAQTIPNNRNQVVRYFQATSDNVTLTDSHAGASVSIDANGIAFDDGNGTAILHKEGDLLFWAGEPIGSGGGDSGRHERIEDFEAYEDSGHWAIRSNSYRFKPDDLYTVHMGVANQGGQSEGVALFGVGMETTGIIQHSSGSAVHIDATIENNEIHFYGISSGQNGVTVESIIRIGAHGGAAAGQTFELERWTFWAASLTYVGWRRTDGESLDENVNYTIRGDYYGDPFEATFDGGYADLPNGQNVYIVNRGGRVHIEGGEVDNFHGITIDSAAEPGAAMAMKENSDAMAAYWHSTRLKIELNDTLYSMTGQERLELTFIEVMNSANIEMYSHIALTEKLFEPIDDLFGTNPGEMFAMLEDPIRSIEDYCQQYGEFDMENPQDWDVYNDVDELLNGLNMIDMIDPKLMSLKMDFIYMTENGRELTVMPMGISGSKGANEVIVPYIRNKESVQ